MEDSDGLQVPSSSLPTFLVGVNSKWLAVFTVEESFIKGPVNLILLGERSSCSERQRNGVNKHQQVSFTVSDFNIILSQLTKRPTEGSNVHSECTRLRNR